VCLAVPGARTHDVIDHQLPAALDLLGPGTVAVVTVGANDVGRLVWPRRFVARYRALVATLSATGATVVTVGMPDIGAATVMAQPLRAMLGWVGRRADRHVQRLAAAHGAHFVAIDVSPPSGTPSHVYLAADRWHPNDDTYHLWAEGMAALLAPVLLAGSTLAEGADVVDGEDLSAARA
jgi:lysophospholipase L1-like esterase